MVGLSKQNIISLSITFGLMTLTGCASSGLGNQYQYQSQNSHHRMTFPSINTAWQKNGQFPNVENLSKIMPGLEKDELYQLIGRPHFDEFAGAREWDYIMKFYRNDKSVQVCQYKILFNSAYRVQSTHWSPTNCEIYARPLPQVIIQQQVAPIMQPQNQVSHEKLTLDADALFAFNKSGLVNMLPQGRIELDNMVHKLRQFSLQGDIKIYITGHTDYKGTHQYNYDLSKRRADTVLDYLSRNGINRSIMSASGAGEDFPIKQCRTDISRSREITCLQENRRVEIDVVIHKRNHTVNSVINAPIQQYQGYANTPYLQNHQAHLQANVLNSQLVTSNGVYINPESYHVNQQGMVNLNNSVGLVQSPTVLPTTSNVYLQNGAPNINYTNPRGVYMQNQQPNAVYLQR